MSVCFVGQIDPLIDWLIFIDLSDWLFASVCVYVCVYIYMCVCLCGCGCGCMRKDYFYLTMYSIHFIYRYVVMDHSTKEETHCCHYMGYSFRLATRVLLYTPSHRQDSTYHSLCCTSRGALAGTRNSLHNERTLYHGATSQFCVCVCVCVCALKIFLLMDNGYINQGGPIELFLFPASVPQLYVLSCLWNDAYKTTLAANQKQKPM